jgi:hypothetical protein
VVPTKRSTATGATSSPRAGGGGPVGDPCPTCGGAFSPRRRGWSLQHRGRPGRVRQFSPRRRGWSLSAVREGEPMTVLPAQAGVVPSLYRRPSTPTSSPRAGGGGPADGTFATGDPQFSPRRRGWSQDAGRAAHPREVLPAQAGVVPAPSAATVCRRRSPRAGGGGPVGHGGGVVLVAFSPRRRGWSLAGHAGPDQGHVLPAQAGVVPSMPPTHTTWSRSPRAGGGGPGATISSEACDAFSPRRRGWSRRCRRPTRPGHVLPAQAGVVPRSSRR